MAKATNIGNTNHEIIVTDIHVVYMFKGDECRLTGGTHEKYGTKWYDVVMLEGHEKGSLKVISQSEKNSQDRHRVNAKIIITQGTFKGQKGIVVGTRHEYYEYEIEVAGTVIILNSDQFKYI